MKKKIEYLVGKNSKLNRTFEPFNLLVINFLDDFSKSLDNKLNNQKYPDLKALSFFCRKKHLLSLQKNI